MCVCVQACVHTHVCDDWQGGQGRKAGHSWCQPTREKTNWFSLRCLSFLVSYSAAISFFFLRISPSPHQLKDNHSSFLLFFALQCFLFPPIPPFVPPLLSIYLSLLIISSLPAEQAAQTVTPARYEQKLPLSYSQRHERIHPT